jgi:sugar (pentulose or hexulose) kinase
VEGRQSTSSDAGGYILTIDLGTTNIKSVVFDSSLRQVSQAASEVRYRTAGAFVEFDPDGYWKTCRDRIVEAIRGAGIDPRAVRALSLTGQAESLVILDERLEPLRMGISWMDNRSVSECEDLRRVFPPDVGYGITGQPDIITTWPITKILWLREHEKEIYRQVRSYLLIKDFILHKLTGNLVGEYTVYNFSYYFDIVQKRFWEEALEYAGIREAQLPELVEPGARAGELTRERATELGLAPGVPVNAGALDHFAAMIGSGNIREGMVSETTGTVLAVATMVRKPSTGAHRLPCHYGAIRGSYVMLPVCESGGISLEWFKRNFYPDAGFDGIDREVERLGPETGEVIFLPYLTGTNSPEFDPRAAGVFYGLKVRHTKAHLARAVMEGVAFLLKKNLDVLERLCGGMDGIISLGGGARSDLWNRIKADITGKPVTVPESVESASLGAAILAAVEIGMFPDIPSAVKTCVRAGRVFKPGRQGAHEGTYRRFIEIYERLKPVFHSE